MSPLKLIVFSLWILTIFSTAFGEAFAQSEPAGGEAAVLENRFGLGSLLRILPYIVIAAIAGVAILVLWKRKLIF